MRNPEDMPMKYYWMGEDIDTLSRERLIEIIAELGRELDATRKSAVYSMRTMARIAKSVARR